MNRATLIRRACAEAIGSALLVACVVGSGVMAEKLAGGNAALALLGNTLATGAVLFALIVTLGTISGAHFNPVVSLCDAWEGGIPWRDLPVYVASQVGGAIAGTILAHAMFGLSLLQTSTHVRSGGALLLSEAVATFGLMAVIWGTARRRPESSALAVALWIVAAYWFTASTSFANPAVTIARSLTDTFSGVRPVDVPGFVVAQLAGAVLATILFRWLVPDLRGNVSHVVAREGA